MGLGANLLIGGFVCAALARGGGPRPLEPDPAGSFIAARTDKSGLLSFAAGHKHGILATKWTARLCVDEDDAVRSLAVIAIPAASLRIDTPEARRLAGLESRGPADIATLQTKMLAPENLAAAQYPEIRFESTGADQQKSALVLRGILTLRGRRQAVIIPVTIDHPEGGYRFRGLFRIRQTDFGIEPASVAGVVKVKNEVEILFDIRAKPAAGACE